MCQICTLFCIKMALFERFEHSKVDQTVAVDHYLHPDHIPAVFLEIDFYSIFTHFALATTRDFHQISQISIFGLKNDTFFYGIYWNKMTVWGPFFV